MILKRNNHRQIIFTLGAVLLCFFFAALFTHSTSAYTKITSGQIKLISDFTLEDKANAGGTITKGYYVFPDTRGAHGGPGTIKVVDRNTCQMTDTVKIGSMYLSGLYNKWGTNYITLIGMGSQKGCYKLNGSKLQQASGCSTPPGRSLTYQGTGQGNTATYNGYTFKVAGYSGGLIGVWNSSGSRVATFQVPSSVVDAEPENISVDGDTGEVYINYADKINGKRHSLWYKIDSSVFSKYTGKRGTSNPTRCKNNTATGGGSSARTAKKSAAKKKDPNSNKGTYTPSVSTYDGVVSTIFFGTIQDDSEGCGVYTVLDLIMTILTIGIGVAALIGISISGITYLTAKNDVAKTTKAKRRIYEIVVGLVAYAAIWGILTFLLPEFNPELKACKTLTAEEIAAREASKQSASSLNLSTNTNTNTSANSSANKECMSKALPQIRDSICQISTASERIAKTAELLAIHSGKKSTQNRFTKPKKWSQISGAKPPTYFQNAYDKYRKGHWSLYSKTYGNVTRVGASCDIFVATVLKSTGYTNPKGYTHGAIRSKLKDKNKWKVVKTAKRGDVCQNGDKHIRIYLGNGKIAEAQSGASSGVSKFGHITSGGCKGYTIYRAIK